MSFAEIYYGRANEMLAHAWTANAPTIARLAPVIGASLARGGVLHTFGSGHSELIAREIIGRYRVHGISSLAITTLDTEDLMGRLQARHARFFRQVSDRDG